MNIQYDFVLVLGVQNDHPDKSSTRLDRGTQELKILALDDRLK